MFKNKRKIVVFSFIGALIIIILFVALWLFLRSQSASTTPANNSTSTPGQKIIERQINSLPPTNPQRSAEDSKYTLGLKQTAVSVAERLGSYSSDQRFENLSELQSVMTAKMQNDAKNMALKEMAATSTYFGVSTRALSIKLVSITDAKASLLVQTQRAITTGDNPQPKIIYKNIALTFVKADNKWLLDSAKWQ
ncbi:MAG: hypothetical protein WC516_00295 [Patescibacteria group bacterium]